jgi:sugar phosphate isomerase/epimerase
MILSRREFLAAGAGTIAAPLLAIEPIKRPAKSEIKLSLAAYSFRKYLDLKKPSMTLFEFIDFAATLPLDAVELTSYYFAETTDAYLDKVKAHATAKKLPISGVPIRTVFTMKDDAKRAAEVAAAKEWIPRAARLGAQTIRIFAGDLPKGDDLEVCRKRVVEAIEDCCEVAKKAGVLLALENHGGIVATPEGVLAIVKAVKSDAFGVNVDTGNFKTADPYGDVAKIAPYGVVSQVKVEVFPDGKREEADLPRMMKVLKDAKFHGYAALEYEAADEPKTAVPKYVKQLRSLI